MTRENLFLHGMAEERVCERTLYPDEPTKTDLLRLKAPCNYELDGGGTVCDCLLERGHSGCHYYGDRIIQKGVWQERPRRGSAAAKIIVFSG